ncbi:MAG TPA: hypothetical protein VJQ44_06105 [Gemmatimonadales bacterium]|nr:hypothetical protein [Gemmatimonadales bacterium]
MVYQRRALSPLFLGLAMCAPSAGAPPAAVPTPAPVPAAAPVPADQPVPSTDVASVPDPDPGPQDTVRSAAVVRTGPELSADEIKLWQKTVRPRLARDQWLTPARYDAAYLFMLPLHAAFERNYAEGQAEMADQVARFLAQRDTVKLNPDAQISWLQYFYFLSRFMVLAADHGRTDLIPAELPGALRGWIADLWLRGPAWQWFRKPFPGGVRERVEWKLSDAEGPGGKAFEHAILDQELFLFAIGADLRHYGRTVGSPLAHDKVLEELDRFSRRVYDARVVWNADSGWTFQPTIWRDHPDHVYECRTEKQAGLKPCDRIGGSEDASHTHRFPLWMRSLIEAAPPNSPEQAYYTRLLWGLERQFFDRVLVKPSAEFAGYRLRNYMDGENGLYRWGYKQFGPDQGYGPYELSFALLSSWWGFLPGPRARQLFGDVAKEFPLSPELLKVYMGPPPKGRPAGKPNGILVDGTAKFLCLLAAELPEPAT